MQRVGIYILSILFLTTITTTANLNAANNSKARPQRGIQSGLAAFYGIGLHGQKTASGERFNKNDMVAAHRTYPLGSLVKVTNLENGRAVVVRINDRGPANSQVAKGVIIDLSHEAAKRLDFVRDGKTRVKLQVIKWGEEK